MEKKGNKDPGNLRPITLHNAIGNITSKIITYRVTKEQTDRHLLRRANEGFLVGKGTNNAIHSILNIWEDAKEFKGQPCGHPLHLERFRVPVSCLDGVRPPLQSVCS
jgi:hypothetical protein